MSVSIDERGSRKLLANLDTVGDQVIVAQGGMGGGPTNGWMGKSGQAMHVRLDLRVSNQLYII